jgi:hypothetical protein
LARCKIDGCDGFDWSGGLCQRHYQICSYDGCQKYRERRSEYCVSHGGSNRKRCIIEGCESRMHRNGLCTHHGSGRPICKTQGCKNRRLAGGHCWRHTHNLDYKKRQTTLRIARVRDDPRTKIRYKIPQYLRRIFHGQCTDEFSMRTVGLRKQEFRDLMISKFHGRMTVENYGSYWTIGHIYAVARFDILDPVEYKRCNHYTNLQPEKKRYNFSKFVHLSPSRDYVDSEDESME